MGPAASANAPRRAALVVEDDLEQRIRKPADLLRLVIGCVGLGLLAAAAVVAHATATGAETDIAAAGRRLPGALFGLPGPAAGLALLILPVALAVRQFLRNQPRRLAEAVATSAVTVAVVVAANALLRLPAAAHLYAALTVSHPGLADTTPLDAYLAALAAYVTVIDLSGRPRWRVAVWLAVGVYSAANLAAMHTTALSLAIALLLGTTVGIGVRYAAGLPSQRPTAVQIAEALKSTGLQVIAMRRTHDALVTSRAYTATLCDGNRLDVTVLDRDQEAAGALYRFYRAVRVQRQVSRGVPLSLEQAIERRALLSYAAAQATVRTPRLRAVVRAGPEAAVLAHDHDVGTTLAENTAPLSDGQLRRVWGTVLRLHAHGITHRALTADRILITDDGDVVLLDPSNGDVAASELQLRLDLAQLLAELALLVGPDKAADAGLAEVGVGKLVALAPLLQPVALHRSTRAALRRRRDVLPALRARLLAAAPDRSVAPVRLERVRPRTLVSLVGGIAAAYVLAGQLARVNLASVIRHADWRWTAAALAVSALTYAAAALSLSGFVLAGLVALLLAAIAVRPGRRLLRARLVPTLEQVLPRLLDVAQNPRKVAAGLGGALALTVAYVLCLAACVRALGGALPITSVAVVYLTGSALGSAAPTPGGLGAVEVALSAGLTAAGLPNATAISSVLLFRLLTFWLPVPFGWAAFNFLQRRQAL